MTTTSVHTTSVHNFLYLNLQVQQYIQLNYALINYTFDMYQSGTVENYVPKLPCTEVVHPYNGPMYRKRHVPKTP